MFSHHDGLLGDDDSSPRIGQDSGLAVSFPTRANLDRLRAAFPDFAVGISRGWRGPVFEAWRDPAAGGLYAVITDDARELWRELEACQQRAADDFGSTL
jgi:hypothetical protein